MLSQTYSWEIIFLRMKLLLTCCILYLLIVHEITLVNNVQIVFMCNRKLFYCTLQILLRKYIKCKIRLYYETVFVIIFGRISFSLKFMSNNRVFCMIFDVASYNSERNTYNYENVAFSMVSVEQKTTSNKAKPFSYQKYFYNRFEIFSAIFLNSFMQT